MGRLTRCKLSADIRHLYVPTFVVSLKICDHDTRRCVIYKCPVDRTPIPKRFGRSYNTTHLNDEIPSKDEDIYRMNIFIKTSCSSGIFYIIYEKD